jgi:hypothetical protein
MCADTRDHLAQRVSKIVEAQSGGWKPSGDQLLYLLEQGNL